MYYHGLTVVSVDLLRCSVRHHRGPRGSNAGTDDPRSRKTRRLILKKNRYVDNVPAKEERNPSRVGSQERMNGLSFVEQRRNLS